MGKHLLAAAFVFMLALALFGLGYAAGNRGPDISPQVDSLTRRAAATDSLYAHQRAEDSVRVAEAAQAAEAAQRQAWRSGRALPGLLPAIPETTAVMDSGQVVALRGLLAAFGQHLASHLRDDSLAADTVAQLVGTLKGAAAGAWAVADSLRAERDEGLRLLRVRARKPFPVALVLGVAVTPRGVQPALAVGLRVPLPRLF